MRRFRIKDKAPMHFVDGRIYHAGDIAEYPDHITGGQWLEPIEDAPVVEAPKRRGRPPKEIV